MNGLQSVIKSGRTFFHNLTFVFWTATSTPGTFRPATFRPTAYRPAAFRPVTFRPVTFRPATFRPTIFATAGIGTDSIFLPKPKTEQNYISIIDPVIKSKNEKIKFILTLFLCPKWVVWKHWTSNWVTDALLSSSRLNKIETRARNSFNINKSEFTGPFL